MAGTEPAIRIPERRKQPGVCYTVTDDGIELPVIDLTHPAFAVGELDPALAKAFIESEIERYRNMAPLSPEALRSLMERSILVRGGVEAAGGVMSGLTTYLYRLGPANLGDGYASDIDRKIAGGLLPSSFRYRLRDMVEQLVGAVAPRLTPAERRPLELVNIGGGPAMDSVNALLFLRQRRPDPLAGRPVRIHVLDRDAAGPRLGARAVAALRMPGAPLEGMDVVLRHRSYDWTQTDTLRAVLGELEPGAVAAGSSEGALFAYASDEIIVANLRVLREATPPDFVMVGSVACEISELDPRLQTMATDPRGPRIRYLGLGPFTGLAAQAGWRVASSIGRLGHHIVALHKA